MGGFGFQAIKDNRAGLIASKQTFTYYSRLFVMDTGSSTTRVHTITSKDLVEENEHGSIKGLHSFLNKLNANNRFTASIYHMYWMEE